MRTFLFRDETWTAREYESTAPGGEFSEQSDMAWHLEFYAPGGMRYDDDSIGPRLEDMSDDQLVERVEALLGT